MNTTTKRPTPETDAAFRDGYTFCAEDMRPAVAFCANLERERDEAREQLEAMREAIKEAYGAIKEAREFVYWDVGTFRALNTTLPKSGPALAKLQPLLNP